MENGNYVPVTLRDYGTGANICKVHLFDPKCKELKLLDLLSVVHYLLTPGHFFHVTPEGACPLKSDSRIWELDIFYLPMCKTSGAMRKHLVTRLSLPPGVHLIVRSFLIPVKNWVVP